MGGDEHELVLAHCGTRLQPHAVADELKSQGTMILIHENADKTFKKKRTENTKILHENIEFI